MDYRVLITPDAENDLEEFVKYLVIDKKNKQAAENLLKDFELTLENLERVAGSLRYCDNPRLSELGYKKIHFIAHRYFLLFRLEGNKAVVDAVFHELQDYENKIR